MKKRCKGLIVSCKKKEQKIAKNDVFSQRFK